MTSRTFTIAEKNVLIPKGWKIQEDGVVKKGDKYFSYIKMRWANVGREDIGKSFQYDSDNSIDFLIRREDK